MKFLKALLLSGIIVLVVSCSGDSTQTEVPQKGTLKITSALPQTVVKTMAAKLKDDGILGQNIDSIVVGSVRILISELKLFSVNIERPLDDNVQKTGPFVLNFDGSQVELLITSGLLPVGLYDKVKFEFHRFSASELPTYQNDPVFKDFATSDRYSVIIRGIYFIGNKPTAFTYNGTVTANLMLNILPPLQVAVNTVIVMQLNVNASDVFKKGSTVLDPTDSKNINDIDNNIKAAIKAVKK